MKKVDSKWVWSIQDIEEAFNSLHNYRRRDDIESQVFSINFTYVPLINSTYGTNLESNVNVFIYDTIDKNFIDNPDMETSMAGWSQYGCNHSWKTYEGFTEKYEYCTQCDEKKR